MHSCKNEVCVLNVKIFTKNKQTMPKGVVSGGWARVSGRAIYSTS